MFSSLEAWFSCAQIRRAAKLQLAHVNAPSPIACVQVWLCFETRRALRLTPSSARRAGRPTAPSMITLAGEGWDEQPSPPTHAHLCNTVTAGRHAELCLIDRTMAAHLMILAVTLTFCAASPPSSHGSGGRPPAAAAGGGVDAPYIDASGMVVIAPAGSLANATAGVAGAAASAAEAAAPNPLASFRFNLTLPAGSYHAAQNAGDLCKAPKARTANLQWNATLGRFVQRQLQPSLAPSPSLTPLERLETPAATPLAPSSTPPADAPLASPTDLPAVRTAPQHKVDSAGRRWKCCDNVDCSPGSPSWAGDCDKQVACGQIVCPPFEVVR